MGIPTYQPITSPSNPHETDCDYDEIQHWDLNTHFPGTSIVKQDVYPEALVSYRCSTCSREESFEFRFEHSNLLTDGLFYTHCDSGHINYFHSAPDYDKVPDEEIQHPADPTQHYIWHLHHTTAKTNPRLRAVRRPNRRINRHALRRTAIARLLNR